MDRAEQLGLDTRKVVLGYTLITIIGDDENAIGASRGFSRNRGQQAGRQILARLDWEASIQLLPGEIIEQLNQVRNQLGQLDWSTKGGFIQGCGIWLRDVKGYIDQQINVDPALRKGVDYYKKHETIIGQPTEEFIKQWLQQST